MTMPGLRATSVRRTVIVAVALVTGQALLGAVIGFMTFDRADEAPAPARAAEPAVAPPIVVPPASMPAPTEASRPPRKRAVADASSGTRGPGRASSASARTVTEPPAAPAAPQLRTTVPTPPPSSGPPPPAPPAPGLVPSPDVDEPEDPPVVREPCEDEGATGRTDDGKVVRCERGRDGKLRWRPV
ncbi:hypothetical protein COUCH_07445 [Couchioplanes caeruleus]|uniref:hypothetical protein n=1 Tax=Couchioplanes caeruleus TaxID=56438 RepID=UPI0020BF1F1B|nr:hypothetical protein [Couchioplanes caeruleus]UQU66120.1 hypothetical protein COUCH_07445 [Couchioplanes caeruleus]